jgi:hypothetical protein
VNKSARKVLKAPKEELRSAVIELAEEVERLCQYIREYNRNIRIKKQPE